MERVEKRRLIRRQQLEDVPELIQQIQSLLPAVQAARTCVMSKSWLYALSTTPTLRLRPVKSLNKQQERRYMRLINRTLRRYHRDNLPIITCNLHFGIYKQKSVSRAEKWIKLVTSKTCLKELCLTILPNVASFTLPDDIFASEKLNKLSLKLDISKDYYSLRICSNPMINCVNLRVLELHLVHISEEVLNNLLSTCKLLEKIDLELTKRLKKIKVNNLLYLHELKISPRNGKDNLEISDVPSLHSFFYDLVLATTMPVLSNTDSIGSLRELYLNYVVMDDACSDMINSKFPFLETLTLNLTTCFEETLDIRCVSLRRLTVRLMRGNQSKVQVCAPKLLFFRYECSTIPDFLFPIIAPEQFELSMERFDSIDHMLFLKMRDALNLSSNFKIEINFFESVVLFDVDVVRTRIPFPATNVEKLLFVSYSPQNLRDKSLLTDVLFSICRPNQVEVSYLFAHNVANYLSAIKKETGNAYWPHVEIRDPEDGKWETLSTSTISLLDEWYHCEFKPNWCFP